MTTRPRSSGSSTISQDVIRTRRALAPDEWLGGVSPKLEDVGEIIDGPAVLRESAGGPPLLVHLPLAGVVDVEPLRRELDGVKFTFSKRTHGLKAWCRSFGFLPRVAIRQDWCSEATLAADFPAASAALHSYAPVLEEVYARHDPARFAKHRGATLANTRPEYRVAGGVFTSGIVNRNNALHYHRDSGNYLEAWSAMIVLRRGVTGGPLLLPEFGVGFACEDASLVLFDGGSIIHGVGPLFVTPGGRRYSIVYYSLRQIWKCLTFDEELARAKRRTTEIAENRRSKA